MELRERVAKAVDVYELAAGKLDPWDLADRILAIPEIAEALEIHDLAKGGAGPFPTEIGKPRNLGHSISTNPPR